MPEKGIKGFTGQVIKPMNITFAMNQREQAAGGAQVCTPSSVSNAASSGKCFSFDRPLEM